MAVLLSLPLLLAPGGALTGCGSSGAPAARDAAGDARGGSGGATGDASSPSRGPGGPISGGDLDAADDGAVDAPGMGGAGGAGGAGGSGGGPGPDAPGACPLLCPLGRVCCDGNCVNTANDPFNCGRCGVRCEGGRPYCQGSCQPPPCEAGTACSSGTCCGSQCCTPGQLCCDVQGPIGGATSCHTPTAEAPTCPQGCAPLCISDRNLKKNIEPVDPAEVLEKVGRLPLATWTYRSEPDGIRHLGPMAQDFRAAFGLGNDDRSYHAVDAHGVALAAIQALQAMAADQRRRIQSLEDENRTLSRRLRRLESTLPHTP
jgi:hypothetical protein